MNIKFWNHWTERIAIVKEYSKNSKVLQLGPGLEDKVGVTIDCNSELNPDILHDLNITPWPIENESFDLILLFSVIEHMVDPLETLVECHRILNHGGRIVILTPHYSDSASFVDPTHKVHFSMRSFDYLIPGTKIYENYGFYKKATFEVDYKLLTLQPFWMRFPMFQYFANKYIGTYENYFCHIFPASAIYFELRKI